MLQCSDVDGLLAHMPSLRQLVLSRQPAGLGFGPYIRWAWVEVCSWTVL